MLRPLRLIAATLLTALSLTVAAAPLEIVRVTPTGEDVPLARQIVFQFDRAVVPLGRMARHPHEIPVRIQPRVPCRWRWIDVSALACDLAAGETLAPATRYVVHMDPGIVALDGARLPQTWRHEFITERPRVDRVHFETWLTPTTPVLRVSFNQPVTRDGVRANLRFAHLDADQAQHAARVAADHEDGLATLAGGASPAQIAHAALLASTPSRSWLLAPAAALPGDARIALNVQPGVRGAGPQPGIEARTTVSFDTFPEFAFLGVACSDVSSGRRIELAPRASTPGPGPCDPLAGVALLFSSPVRAPQIAAAMRLEPALAGAHDGRDAWRDVRDHVSLQAPHASGRTYPVWLPQRLEAYRGYHITSTPEGLRDAFERPLEVGLDMHFGTAHRRPRLHLAHPAAVLEQGLDSDVPVYVTNLEAIDLVYRHSASIGTHARRLTVPPVSDLSFALPLGVRDILAGGSGVVSGTLTPVPADADQDRSHFFAQVTPFAITVKLGHFSSIAWVTRLDDGKPVAGAALTLYIDKLDALSGPDGGAIGPFITGANGIARLPGSAVLDPELSLLETWQRPASRLFLRVDKDGELGVLPLDNDFRVWTREVWPQRQRAFGHLKAWGTTAQGIYRGGDTIQYKLYLRHQDTHTLVPAPRSGFRLSVIDPRGNTLLDDAPIELDSFGGFAGTLAIPVEAAVGWYRFRVHSVHGDQSLDAFRVLVSDFTPAPFKVRGDINGNAFAPGDRLRVHTSASLHAGGPYTAAPARVTVRVAPRPLRSPHPIARDFQFDTGDADGWRSMYQDEVALDARGERTLDLELGDPGVQYGQLQIESAVSDDRGKRVAAISTASFAARDRFVGLRDTRWLHTRGEPAQVEYLVIDATGIPVPGVSVTLAVQREEVYAARIKGAGNAFQTRYETRWQDAGACAGNSREAAAICEFVPASPGRYRITARIADTAGRSHETSLHTWVQGDGEVVWREPEDGALALVPEQASYQVGDTARFLVRNPFPGATALVTVERYGVLRSWTRRLENATPVIEFTVLPDDLPGFHLSVTVISPRVSAPPPQRGQVDLGKPTMRIGYARVPVEDPIKRLDVTVTPQSTLYRPRDTARIDFQVQARDSGAVPREPVQLAVAVLDEAVFDLVTGGSRNFDPYTGFYALDGLDVVSYSLLTRLVGRQKFEQKGASAGGDGGQTPGLRDLFRFVSYWNPSVAVDPSGHASVELSVPDNLTGWRVLALAVTPGDRMGLGEGSFAVNKDTELRPVMPNQLSARDRFRAGFSVLNRSAAARSLHVEINASGTALDAPVHTSAQVALAPFARQTVWLDVVTAHAGEVRLHARAEDGQDGDTLEHAIPVRSPARLITAATHGSITHGAVEQRFEIPADIDTSLAEITLLASPSIVATAAGALRHLRDYPYACWEQRLSRAVMASRFAALRDYLPPDLEWPGHASLAQQTLSDAARFQAPGGGMAFWLAQDARANPYLSAYTALAFAWLEQDGHSVPESVRERLHAHLGEMLRRDVLPDFYSRGMSSSVRAVALAALAQRGDVSVTDVLRYRDHLPHMSVFAKAMYLDAAWRSDPRHPLVGEVLASLLAHGEERSGGFALAERVQAEGQHLLDTPARANCAALATLSRLAADPALGPTLTPLAAKLARSVTQARARRDHWDNTQENVFCTSALLDHARAFERSAPALQLRASLDGDAMGEVRFASPRDAAVTLLHELTDADAGQNRVLRIEHQGTGRAYYSARLRHAPSADSAQRTSAGMSLHREYSVQRDGAWQLLATPVTLRRGELVRVDLYLTLPAARHFVVVDDPVPGAFEPVQRDLVTSSSLDAEHGAFEAAGGALWFERDDWRGYATGHWSFYHRELRHDAARFFSDYLPAGAYHLSYTAQVIAEGRFAVAPAHAEEMYHPDVFATARPARLQVGPATTP